VRLVFERLGNSADEGRHWVRVRVQAAEEKEGRDAPTKPGRRATVRGERQRQGARKSRSPSGMTDLGEWVAVADNSGGTGWRLRMLVNGGCSKSAEIKKKQIPCGADRPRRRGGGCGQLGGRVAARGAAMRGCAGRRVEVEILRPPGGGLRMTYACIWDVNRGDVATEILRRRRRL
jgi:hypothetical protein